MNTTFFKVILACLIVTLSEELHAIDESKIPSLITRNPFRILNQQKEKIELEIPEKSSAELEKMLEFCGSSSFGGGRRFSVLSIAEDRRYWLGLSESIEGYELVRYNEEERALLLEQNGKLEILKLRQNRRKAKPRSSFGNRNGAQRPTTKAQVQPKSTRKRRIQPRDSFRPKILPTLPEIPQNIPKPPKKPKRV